MGHAPLLLLAGRNVLRNRRRSVITLLAIAAGVASLTFLWAFIDGMNRQMVENSTRIFAGDMQVHVRGYHTDPTPDRTMVATAPVLEVVRRDARVAAASPRLEARMLASGGTRAAADKSRGVLLVGVAPQEEPQVTALFGAVTRGRPLAGGDAHPGVLIGEGLADALGVQPGDELILVGQAYDGSIASGRYPVQGVFGTRIDEVDGFVVVLAIDAVRELLAAPAAASAVVARLHDRGTLAAARAGLSAALGGRYEVVGWPTLLPMVAISLRFHEVTGYVVLLVFFVVVAAAVVNPVLMAVLERTREFGVMLALGTSRSRLLRLVVYEAIVLGALGVALGVAAGDGVTAYLGRTGIDLGDFEAGMRVMPGLADVVYPVLRLDRTAMISATVFATACLTALYPAAKAARLEPVAAIRGRGAARKGRIGEREGGRTPVAGRARWPAFVLIAARNLLRNPRRTAITVGGTAFGIAAFVFLFGFFDGFSEQIVENSTRYLTGHIQLERAGFRRDLAPELALDEPNALLERVRAMPHVVGAAARVQARALASSTSRSEGIVLIGIDPERERAVTFVHRTIVQGVPLAPADRDIVLGRTLADKLGLRLGDKVVVLTQAAGGELGSAALRIAGIFATESDAFDGAIAYVTLAEAQSLLRLGARASTINLRLDDRSAIASALSALPERFAGTDVAAVPWQQLLPQIDEMVRLTVVMGNIVLAMAFAVIAIAIMNTVYMAVAERTREFGVMMALGTPPAAIRRMVVYETIALMLIASVAGYAFGAALVGYFGRSGIDLSGFFQGYAAIPGLTGIIRPVFVPEHLVVPGVLLFAASVLVSIVPAARAARLDPVGAIRHV